MAAPAISDYTAYSGTKFTATDWTFDNQVTVDYLTDGTADFTVNSIETTGNIVSGGTITGTLGSAVVATASMQDWAVTPQKMSRNITSVVLGTDFTTSSASFTTRTGGTVNITITGTKILVKVRTAWYLSSTGTAALRLNINSGAKYISFGGSATASGNNGWGFMGGETLVTGLTPGTHSVTVECKASSGSIENKCSFYPDYACFELISEEV